MGKLNTFFTDILVSLAIDPLAEYSVPGQAIGRGSFIGTKVISANAPVGSVILLPEQPDASARALRAALPGRPAVVIADSFGRAWRVGQCDVAIGIAGLLGVDDWQGRLDRSGRELQATAIAVADEAAAAADLARSGKDAGEPVVVVRGLERFVSADDGPGASALVRARADDLFR